MSSTSSEQAIVSAKANVMSYDDSSKKWNPSGSSPGISKVYIYQNLMNQSYRVVGRKVQDHECVINCMLSKNIKYQANQTFLQWRDTKQVYGLHFQSKDETDAFAQILKTAVDNLSRVAASNGNSNGVINGSGDNISLGKRSISSEYNNPLITDEYERQNYNLNGQNQNGHNIYTGINTQRSQAQLNQVTSPPLSNSSSSSSSTISSNGLVINTINGHHGYHQQNGNHTNGLNGYHNNNNTNNNQRQTPEANFNYQNNQNNQIYNLQQQQLQNQQINISSTSSSSSSSNSSNTQQPLYQSSPNPPPPPPPVAGLFANQQNGLNNSNNNHHNGNDNFSQKIYDVIPDNANYTPNSNQSNHTSNNKISNSAPPPPPLPTGLFNTTPANGAPPPPPPPMASMQSLNLTNSSNTKPSPPPASTANDHASELTRSIANRAQLKKVDDPSNNRQTAPPQLDFLTEIRLKLEAKNRSDANGSSNENENLKPSNGLKKIVRNPISSDSPKPIKKISSHSNVITNGHSSTNGHANGTSNGHTTNGHANGHLDNQSYDKLKQELMSEFRKELQMIKQDIVNSILSELRR